MLLLSKSDVEVSFASYFNGWDGNMAFGTSSGFILWCWCIVVSWKVFNGWQLELDATSRRTLLRD
jgi:hypothetical protein